MDFSLTFPLYDISPRGVTNPDKGKSEGTEQKQPDCIKYYNTKYTGIGMLIEMLSKNNENEPLEYARLYLEGNMQMRVDAEDSLELY